MRKRALSFFAIVVASAVMVASLFSEVVVGPAPQPPIEFDVNVQNTPLPVDVQNTPLPVEVTNPSDMPIATNCTSEWTEAWGYGSSFGFHQFTDDEMVWLDNETVVFTGGSLSGYSVWSDGDGGGGGAPVYGHLVVYDWDISDLIPVADIALPFSSTFRVEDVDFFALYISAVRPELHGTSSFSIRVVGSVFWYIED